MCKISLRKGPIWDLYAVDRTKQQASKEVMNLLASFFQMIVLNTDVSNVLQMYASRPVATDKIESLVIKDEVFTFLPHYQPGN